MTLYEAVRDYHRRGWCVLPVAPWTKRPAVNWKDYQERRPDEAQLDKWFKSGQYESAALVLGPVSGDVGVRDFDEPGSYEAWAEENYQWAARLPTVKTSKGAHVYFQLDIISGRSGIEVYRDGELRLSGGIVLVPPSRHPSGHIYDWIVPLRELPEIDPLEIGLGGEKREKAGAAEGGRNINLTSLAGTMRRRGMSEEAIAAALRAENQSRCDPPLPEEEIDKIAGSVAKYPPVEVGLNRTDMGNAKRLIQRHGADLRYVPAWRSWLTWDGKRWAEGNAHGVTRLMKETVAAIHGEAENAADDDRSMLAKWALASESEQRIRAAVKLAESEVCVAPADLDADEWTINCQNGSLDLRTGELRGHRREDLITNLVRADFSREAECPTWNRFCAEIFSGNGELVEFIARGVGYALTGSIRDHALFVLHGAGRNGKSTFVETLAHLLDGYAKHTPMDTFVSRKASDRIPNDLARLKGSRFVVASETEVGQRLREAAVKQLTGGDVISARFLHKEFFEFRPTFKIFLVCNHKPIIRDNSKAIWDRLHLVPFERSFSKADQDTELPEKLRQEASGVLRWAVEGCEAWQNFGLGECAAVTAATEGYRDEMDILRDFIDSECVEMEIASIQSAELYGRYRAYSERNGEYPMSQKVFSMRLQELGFEKEKTRAGAVWKGLR